MNAPHWNGDDTREFGPVRDICTECGTDMADDAHAPNCSYHPDAFQPDVPAWMNEPNDFGWDPRDEHDSPIDVEEM